MNFIAIDFETAIYSPESACSVGLVKFTGGIETDTYYSLIRPPRLYIRPDFTAIHGLTVEDVKDAPLFQELWDSDIRPFIGDFTLVAHNAPFDMGVLRAVLDWYELPIPELPYFCSCSLARNTWRGLASYSLQNLANNFGIVYKAHNALDDARTCAKLIKMSADKFGCMDTIELLAATGQQLRELKQAGVKK